MSAGKGATAFLLAIALGVVGPPRLFAQAADSVWVNLGSGVYHCPGTQHYGVTRRGLYLPEETAISRGYRPRGNRSCAPARVAEGHRAKSVGVEPGADSLALNGPARPQGPTEDCVLEWITDGDTIECQGLGRVRLIGVDTPEGGQRPFGDAATAGLSALVPGGANLTLELDSERRDRYDRLLAYVWYEGRMLNWLLVRQGWGVALEYRHNVRYAPHFRAAEAAAARELRGLWRVDGFHCRPVEHRRGAC